MKFLYVVYAEESLTLHSFRLLTESDMKELGLKMGARKLLIDWINKKALTVFPNTQKSTVSEPVLFEFL